MPTLESLLPLSNCNCSVTPTELQLTIPRFGSTKVMQRLNLTAAERLEKRPKMTAPSHDLEGSVRFLKRSPVPSVCQPTPVKGNVMKPTEPNMPPSSDKSSLQLPKSKQASLQCSAFFKAVSSYPTMAEGDTWEELEDVQGQRSPSEDSSLSSSINEENFVLRRRSPPRTLFDLNSFQTSQSKMTNLLATSKLERPTSRIEGHEGASSFNQMAASSKHKIDTIVDFESLLLRIPSFNRFLEQKATERENLKLSPRPLPKRTFGRPLIMKNPHRGFRTDN